MKMNRSWGSIKNNGQYLTKKVKRAYAKGSSEKPRKPAPKKKKRGPDACSVYGLHGADGQVMYVGQTRCSLQTRLKWHLKSAKTLRYDVHIWIAGRLAAGETIEIRMLDPEAIWDKTETKWIARLRENGVPLANMTAGGRHGPKLDRIAPHPDEVKREAQAELIKLDKIDWKSF